MTVHNACCNHAQRLVAYRTSVGQRVRVSWHGTAVGSPRNCFALTPSGRPQTDRDQRSTGRAPRSNDRRIADYSVLCYINMAGGPGCFMQRLNTGRLFSPATFPCRSAGQSSLRPLQRCIERSGVHLAWRRGEHLLGTQPAAATKLPSVTHTPIYQHYGKRSIKTFMI